MDRFEEIFPILAIEDDVLIAKNGDLSIIYSINLPQYFDLGKEHLEAIATLFEKFVDMIPEDSIVQKQDYFIQRKNKDNVSDTSGFLSKSDNQFFYEQTLIDHKCYITITQKHTGKSDLSKNARAILEFVKSTHSAMMLIDSEDGFGARRLKKDGIIELLSYYFSLTQNQEELYDITFKDHFKVKDNFAQIYSLVSNKDLPNELTSEVYHSAFSTEKTDFFMPYIHALGIGFECNHMYSQTIYIENSKSLENKIEGKANKFKGLVSLSRHNKLAYQDLNEFLDHSQLNNLKFAQVNCSLVVWDNNFDKFQEYQSEAMKRFKKLGLNPITVTAETKTVYLANCPGNASYLPDYYRFICPTRLMSTLMNLETTYESNTNGLIFCDRIYEEPVKVDLWDEPVKRGVIVNRNRLIFGPSGTGKSFLINHIVSQYYDQGHHVIMLDIGNSYKKLCQLVKGEYLAYEDDAPLNFNPFKVDEITIDKKEFLISLLIMIWKGMGESCRREEKVVLTKYLNDYYEELEKENSKIKPYFNTFYEFVRDHSVDGDIFFDKKSFLIATQEFYKDGDYGNVLNSDSKMDLLHQRFIVFELDNIKDHPVLFPVVTMLAIETTMDKVRKLKGIKKSIFIDECWKPLSQGEMVEFIKYLYKTIRKFYGEVAIATQDVDDILATDAGPAMINNTDTMMMLSHKKKISLKDKFTQHMSFSQSDVEKLFSVEKREVFIKVGHLSRVYKVKVSPQRYACYSSNGEENAVIYEKFSKSHGNMQVALQEFVDEM